MPDGDENNNEQQQSNEKAYTPPASQADLDQIIEGRLARERKSFEGFEDFKAKATKWDELEDGKKTPDQKAIDEAYEKGSTETSSKMMRRLIGTETKAIAASLGFNDPADALQVLGEELPMKDDEPDSDAITKLIEKLATDKPYLVKDTVSRKPRTRPKTAEGDSTKDDDAQKGGKGKAAAALRQLAASRKGS
jgi:hypothetical protein